MAKLGTTLKPSDDTIAAFEKFVCKIYAPKTSLTTVKELRWFLFRRRQAESEKLPPSEGALRETVLRAHYQAMVWYNANPDLPSPEGYGWKKTDDAWCPIMTSFQPAPESIIELVRCGYKTLRHKPLPMQESMTSVHGSVFMLRRRRRTMPERVQ